MGWEDDIKKLPDRPRCSRSRERSIRERLKALCAQIRAEATALGLNPDKVMPEFRYYAEKDVWQFRWLLAEERAALQQRIERALGEPITILLENQAIYQTVAFRLNRAR